MSYQEKKTIASMVSGLPVLVAYCIYAIVKYRAGGADISYDLKFWATSMLIFMGIGIVIAIVTQILFHIVFAAGGEIKRRVAAEIAKEIKHKVPDYPDCKIEENVDCIEDEDEMDKLIGLKATRVGYSIAGIGFVIALVTVVLQLPPMVMLNTIFLTFGLASLCEGAAQLYYYKKGL